jgi:hypothetical protein
MRSCVLAMCLLLALASDVRALDGTLTAPQLAKPTTAVTEGDALHAKYEAAWIRCEAAIAKVTGDVNKRLDDLFNQAADAGNLDLAEMWDKKKKLFSDTKTLEWPSDGKAKIEWRKKYTDIEYPEDFSEAVKTAQVGYAAAVAGLKEDYEALVKEYTKERNLGRAKQLRDEVAGLERKPVAQPERPRMAESKPDAKPSVTASDTGEIIRVRYHFATNGSCKLETERLKTKAEPVPGGYRKEDKGNGVWQITESFADEESLSRFSGPFSELTNVSFSAERTALALSPKKGGQSKAVLVYPKRLRLPLTVEADISTAEEHGHLQINPNAAMPPNIHPFANVFTHNGGSNLDLSCSWVVARDTKKSEPTIQEVFGERGVSTNKPFSKESRSPVGVDPEMIYIVNIGAFDAGPDNSTWYLTRLSVTARFAPTLGLALKQDGDRVFAGDVLKKSLAEKAGIKAGDVVVSIDGKSPSTMQRALALLSMTNYGESWDIEVERDGQKKTFTIKAE